MREFGVRRVEDSLHPRGYRELPSNGEMRKLLAREGVSQTGNCGICGTEFTDYSDIVPDNINPRGMGGAWRDHHPDNIQTVHWWCNGKTDRAEGEIGLVCYRSLNHHAIHCSTDLRPSRSNQNYYFMIRQLEPESFAQGSGPEMRKVSEIETMLDWRRRQVVLCANLAPETLRVTHEPSINQSHLLLIRNSYAMDLNRFRFRRRCPRILLTA